MVPWQLAEKRSLVSGGGKMRRIGLVLLAVFLASGLASQVHAQAGTDEKVAGAEGDRAGDARAAVRGPDEILGRARYSRAAATRYARRMNSTRYIMKTIPIYYRLAPRRNIAPDVLIAQAMVETGYGRYGGDSRPWNMAGIKKGGDVGDAPQDFERPRTAYGGVRMHINHMIAYTGQRPLGKPHDRYSDARAAQRQRGYWIRRISQLGGGIWATDPDYDTKIKRNLNGMGG
jgi:hypothetical protein